MRSRTVRRPDRPAPDEQEEGVPVTIISIRYQGTGLPFAGTTMPVDVAAAVLGTAVPRRDAAATKTQGIRPRTSEPA